MTGKSWLDLGGDPVHVTLKLGLQLAWQRFCLHSMSASCLYFKI